MMEISAQSKTGNLPVIDFSKTYPEKEKNLQDVADLEYIPLETTDDVLLSEQDVLSHVSDKYILVHSPVRGDIFVFNRAGKIVSHFNHRGQGSREYAAIRDESGSNGTILDEKNGEIFVCFRTIQVYSLSGEYKRTLPVNTIQYHSKVFNFDDEALLVYDDIIVNPAVKSNHETKPYRLISKKDGSLISVLDIYLPERNSIFMSIEQGNNVRETQIYFPSNMYYGQDFVIADISSDTLYLLTRDRKLTPLLIRKPSTHASSDPTIVWTTSLITDKFILIGKIPINFNSGGGKSPVFTYELETGEISEMSFIDLQVPIRRNRTWAIGSSPAIAKNMIAELIWPERIINAYKAKRLKGDMEKLAKTLNEDDNPVVRIVKFK
jgi:hypothetical protein